MAPPRPRRDLFRHDPSAPPSHRAVTAAEHRALTRAAVVLLVSGAIRWGWEVQRGPPVAPPDRPDEGPRLLAEAMALRAEQDRRTQPLAEDERLDPNRAPAIELDRLPGVGPATADAIVAARREAGGFLRPEDLLEVPGIGPSTLEKIRPWLEMDGTVPVELARRRPLVGGLATDRDRVDLNRADSAALLELPGIGPALAARVLAARRERGGGFASVEDLLDVPGIGPATLERLRERVVVR